MCAQRRCNTSASVSTKCSTKFVFVFVVFVCFSSTSSSVRLCGLEAECSLQTHCSTLLGAQVSIFSFSFSFSFLSSASVSSLLSCFFLFPSFFVWSKHGISSCIWTCSGGHQRQLCSLFVARCAARRAVRLLDQVCAEEQGNDHYLILFWKATD